MNVDFKEWAETLEKIEVLTVTITPKGEYHVPSEKKGRIVDVSPEQRARLRSFLFDFSCRMDCAELGAEERERLRLSLMEFCAKLTPAAAEPKKARSA